MKIKCENGKIKTLAEINKERLDAQIYYDGCDIIYVDYDGVESIAPEYKIIQDTKSREEIKAKIEELKNYAVNY